MFPMFSFSQMLLENVKKECYSKKTKTEDVYDCFETLKGSKIYIENNNLVIDIIVERQVYPILETYVVENGDTQYTIDYKGDKVLMFKHSEPNNKSSVFIGSSKEFLVFKE